MFSLQPAPVFRDSRPCGVRPLEGGACARVSPFTAQLRADAGSLTLLSIIATNDRDAAGDVLEPDGLRNRDEYLRSAVVLWAHNRLTLPPVGRCVRLEVRPDRIVAETQFSRGVAFAEELFGLYERGVLRAWSLGFVPHRTSGLPGRDGRRGVRVEEWDLVEYSAAPLPESPGALPTAALRTGDVRDRLLREWLRVAAAEAAARRREAFADLLDRRRAVQ